MIGILNHRTQRMRECNHYSGHIALTFDRFICWRRHPTLEWIL